MDKIEMDKRKFYIDNVILKNSEHIEPCLVNFSNGSLKQDSLNRVTGTLSRTLRKKDSHAIKSNLLIESPNYVYEGADSSDPLPDGAQDKLFLGVLDKDTGKMTLVQTSSFIVHPKLKSKKEGSTNQLSYEDQVIRRAELGGKKARLALKKREKSKVDLETMSGALESAVGEVDQALLEEQETSYDHIVPPSNRETKLIERVYLLSSIVTDDELMEYVDYAHDILDSGFEENETSLYSKLFSQTLASCKLAYGDNFELLTKYTCANLYMDTLIYFLKLKQRILKPELLDKIACPSIFVEKIFNQFTLKEKNWIKTSELNDKLVCYILVIALILNSYELSLPVVLQSLGIEKSKLENLVKIVGATIKKTNIILQFPLTKLTVFQRKRKRK